MKNRLLLALLVLSLILAACIAMSPIHVTLDEGWLNVTVIENGQVFYTSSTCLPGCTIYPVP